jgi:hypothetical protein
MSTTCAAPATLSEDEARIVLARNAATGGGLVGTRATAGWVFYAPFRRHTRTAQAPWVVSDTGRAAHLTDTSISPADLIATIA